MSMQDPQPENITGEKHVTHSIEWRINVGYLVLGAALLYVAWKGSRFLSSSSLTDDQEDDRADRGEVQDGNILVENTQR